MIQQIATQKIGRDRAFIFWYGLHPDKKLSNHISTISFRVWSSQRQYIASVVSSPPNFQASVCFDLNNTISICSAPGQHSDLFALASIITKFLSLENSCFKHILDLVIADIYVPSVWQAPALPSLNLFSF